MSLGDEEGTSHIETKKPGICGLNLGLLASVRDSPAKNLSVLGIT